MGVDVGEAEHFLGGRRVRQSHLQRWKISYDGIGFMPSIDAFSEVGRQILKTSGRQLTARAGAIG